MHRALTSSVDGLFFLGGGGDRPCEFQSGCEWRAKKAGEVLALAEDTLMKQRQMGRIVDRKS